MSKDSDIPMNQTYDISQLPRSWQARFACVRAYGLPSASPRARDAYRQLPFGAKLRITKHFLAFLFGPLCFTAKGMWRKGLTLLGAASP